MKLGIKIWSTNEKLISLANEEYKKNTFDYIEISSIVGTYNKEILSKLKGIPTIVHIDNKNVNLSKKEEYETNILAIKEAQKFADFLGSKYIIIHPCHDGTYDDLNWILEKVNDNRFVIENMPGINIFTGEKNLGRTIEELKKIKFNHFCLDIAHAIKTSITLSLNYNEIIKDLFTLKPKIIHISDGKLDNEIDNHLSIGDGDFDFKLLFELIKEKDVMITLETPKTNYESLKEDIKNIKKAKELLNS